MILLFVCDASSYIYINLYYGDKFKFCLTKTILRQNQNHLARYNLLSFGIMGYLY